jgi:uncharacterized Zn finger protein
LGGSRDWDDGDWPPARPRRVEGGIRARSRRGQIGESWWSGRFVAILESLGMGPRLGRGRAYARAGQLLDLEVAGGSVSARVQGSRARPYRVSIGLARFAEADWARVESALAARALYSAKLLAGEMPREVEDVFGSCGLSLFPERAGDLAMSCSCPDWAVPCKHLAATFYLLAEAFDADPFLILAWRGRARDDLLARLRALRALTGPDTASHAAEWPAEAHRFGLAGEDPPLAEQLDRFWASRGDLAVARSSTAQAVAPDLLVRQLDPSLIELRGRDLGTLLASAYNTMAASVRRGAEADET